jgi:hypothetical protein
MAKTSVNDTAEVAETETENTATPDYAPKHVGGGTFEVAGRKIKGKAKAEEYARSLRRADEKLAEPDLSDLMPPGWTSIRDRALQFRNNLRELPMNETHLPDRKTLNPMYDRTYRYLWAAYSDKQDVPDKQSRGYELVSLEMLEELIKEGKCPEHYRNLLRAEGRYLVYADDVLMRFPRVLDRQRIAAREAKAIAQMKKVEQDGKESFERAGVRVEDSQIGSSFTTELRDTREGVNQINF